MATFTSCQRWTDAEIAALTPSDIAQLNYDEMLSLVTTAEPARIQADAPRITESDVLVRLVYALQQRCRNNLAGN